MIVGLSQSDTSGNPTSGISINVGYASGVIAEVSTNYAYRNAQATSIVTSRQNNLRVISMFNINLGGGVRIEANVVAFVADGIQLNFTTADVSGPFLVVFFAGDDLVARAGSQAVDAQDVETVINAPGFPVEAVIGSLVMQNEDHGAIAYGAAAPNGQACYRMFSEGAVGTTNIITEMHSSHGLAYSDPANGNQLYELLFDAFSATGFSITAQGGGGVGTMQYLALGFGGTYEASVNVFQPPNTPQSFPRTGLGLTGVVEFVLLGLTDFAVLDTQAGANSFGFGAFTVDAEFVQAVINDDGAGTTDTSSLSDAVAARIQQPVRTDKHVASFTSMEVDGYTLNYTTSDGFSFFWELALAPAVAAQKDVFLGGTALEQIFAGATEVKQVFVGSTKVWDVG
jgi:hypothetical protein